MGKVTQEQREKLIKYNIMFESLLDCEIIEIAGGLDSAFMDGYTQGQSYEKNKRIIETNEELMEELTND